MTKLNLSCPICATTNRIAGHRLGDKPICGNCREGLFQGKPQVINSANVSKTIHNNDIPILVDCWAPWCGPCRTFAPTFENAARELEPKIRLAKLNTEEHQGVASQWQIRSIPTLILFDKGKEKARVSGALSLSQLKRWLQQSNAL